MLSQVEQPLVFVVRKTMAVCDDKQSQWEIITQT